MLLYRMKWFFILIFLAFIASGFIFTEDIGPELSVSELKPGLFLVVHSYPWPANSVLAVMNDGEILLIDTPYTPRATKSVLDWIKKSFGDRKITAVNTHFHIDRLGGNEALVQAKIPVYASELTPEAIKTRGRKSMEMMIPMIRDPEIKKYCLDFRYTEPSRIFDSKKGLELRFGVEKVIVRFPGTGHSMDNLLVYFPAKKVLFGGCMILSAGTKNPGNVSDGDSKEWLKTMNKILSLDFDYDMVIPGHGEPGGKELVEHTKTVLENNK